MPTITVDVDFISNIKKILEDAEKGADKMGDKIKKAGEEMKHTEKSASKVMEIFKGVGLERLAEKGIELLKEIPAKIYEATVEYEKYKSILGSVIKDSVEAETKMREMSEAGGGVIPVNEMAESFVRLRNIGINPTKKEMKAFADFSKAQGRSYAEFANATINGMRGEFKALKDFGVNINEVNGKLETTFRGQRTTINATKSALREYLTSLGHIGGIEGSVDRAGQNLSGGADKFKDSLETLAINVGSRFKGVFNNFLEGLTTIVERVGKFIQKPASEIAQERNEELQPLIESYKLSMAEGNINAAEYTARKIMEIIPNFFEGVNQTDMVAVNNKMLEYFTFASKLKQKEELELERDRLLKNKYEDAYQRAIERVQKGLITTDYIKQQAASQGYNPNKPLQVQDYLEEFVKDQTNNGIDITTTLESISNIAGYKDKNALEDLRIEREGIDKNVEALKENARKLEELGDISMEKVEPNKPMTLDDQLGKEAKSIEAGKTLKSLIINIDTMVADGGITIETQNITESAQQIKKILVEELNKAIVDVASSKTAY